MSSYPKASPDENTKMFIMKCQKKIGGMPLHVDQSRGVALRLSTKCMINVLKSGKILGSPNPSIN